MTATLRARLRHGIGLAAFPKRRYLKDEDFGRQYLMEDVLHLMERAGFFHAGTRRNTRGLAAMIVAFGLSAFLAVTASRAQETDAAQPADAAAETAAATIELELNKLEAEGNSCRAYIVVNNTGKESYSVYKLDLVMFQPDGVIGRRFAVDLAPIRPEKRSVKLFDIDNLKCEEIGSFLINDAVECSAEGAAIDNCLVRIKASSRTKVDFTK